jgi:hypothetical protein
MLNTTSSTSVSNASSRYFQTTLHSSGPMEKCSRMPPVIQRVGQVEADRPHRRHPAHTDTDTGLQVRQFKCVEGVAWSMNVATAIFGNGILILTLPATM